VLINLARAFERRATPWVAAAGIRS
jgi:hypothetical protein